MKKNLFVLLIICICNNGFSQKKEKTLKQGLLENVGTNTCKCIDSINLNDKSKEEITEAISDCIDSKIGAYQLALKLADIDELKKNADEKDGKKQIDISVNTNKNSKEYKEYYYDLERYMMANCSSLKNKIASNDKQSDKSFSENSEALKLYSSGIDESKKGNFKLAVTYFEKAVAIDSLFAFAWDNIGICYRQLENYDKALEAYKRSLEIDPKGLMPLQNIPIVYQYKKEYQKAIEAYEKFAEVDKNNPEIYYGIGQIYALNLSDNEKGLDNMCKAYNLYIEQKSPYRTDAEKIIQIIYTDMKKQGKEDQFFKILTDHNINSK